MISFILNIPYTIIGFLVGLISGPVSIRFNNNPYAFILKIRKFWWVFGYMKGVRAMTIGHVVLLGQDLEAFDLEHEFVHVKQYTRLPIIFPILYKIELIRKGYKNNKYEEEAYNIAGNVYKE